MAVSVLRRRNDTVWPTTLCSSVVSVVRRGEQVAGAGGFKEGNIHAQQMVQHVAPDVGHHALAKPGHQVRTGIGGQREQHRDRQ